MIRQHWKQIGIDLQVNEVERGLGITRQLANQHQMFTISNDGSNHPLTFPTHLFPNAPGNPIGPKYGTWFATNGAQGKEPPQRMQDLMVNAIARVTGGPQCHRDGCLWNDRDVIVDGLVSLRRAQ